MLKIAHPDISRFPSEISSFFAGANIYDSSHHSSSTIYYCDTGFYVKVDEKGALAEEARLGRIFHRMALGVEVAAYISQDMDFLVTRSAAGRTLASCLDDPQKACTILAETFQKLHNLHNLHNPHKLCSLNRPDSQKMEDIPVSSRYQRYMDAAGGDFSGGYYDISVSMDRFPIHSKEEAWAIMQANRGLLKPGTLIHGDACLSNIIWNHGQFESFIDFRMAGAGDRHIDLYWVAWSLQNTLQTGRFTDYFLDAYGRENFEYETLQTIAAFEVFG